MANWPWTGRVDARHGMAALCVALTGALAGTALTGGCTAGSGRAVLSAGYAAIMATQDANGDGMLDRSEVTAMVEAVLPPEKKRGTGWDALRRWLVAFYFESDANRDGRLSPAELGTAAPAEGLDGFVATNAAEGAR